jgi:excisionase family DNA binding protein
MPRKAPSETPLYVRLPNDASDKLDRAATALGVRKKDLVANLVTTYVDPDSKQGLTALGTLATRKVLDTNQTGPMLGTYSFQSYAQDFPDVMNAKQAGQFLQIEEKLVVELAEKGQLPGKKLGPVWRFSREALVAWLAQPDR